jgi:hypothetical protein
VWAAAIPMGHKIVVAVYKSAQVLKWMAVRETLEEESHHQTMIPSQLEQRI